MKQPVVDALLNALHSYRPVLEDYLPYMLLKQEADMRDMQRSMLGRSDVKLEEKVIHYFPSFFYELKSYLSSYLLLVHDWDQEDQLPSRYTLSLFYRYMRGRKVENEDMLQPARSFPRHIENYLGDKGLYLPAVAFYIRLPNYREKLVSRMKDIVRSWVKGARLEPVMTEQKENELLKGILKSCHDKAKKLLLEWNYIRSFCMQMETEELRCFTEIDNLLLNVLLVEYRHDKLLERDVPQSLKAAFESYPVERCRVSCKS